MKINLSTPVEGTSKTHAQPYDWETLRATLGDTVKTAWVRAEYVVFRADHGTGPVPVGRTIPLSGTAWLTVCHHGNGKGSHTGAVADRQVGRDRATWCESCKAGKAGTMPLLGATPAPTAQTTTAQQTGPATPAKATPAVTSKASR